MLNFSGEHITEQDLIDVGTVFNKDATYSHRKHIGNRCVLNLLSGGNEYRCNNHAVRVFQHRTEDGLMIKVHTLFNRVHREHRQDIERIEKTLNSILHRTHLS